jgi:alpha-beta hydrolase superfamily lysophospholipase
MARAYTLRAGVRLDGLVLSAPGFRQALLARILGALARRLSHQDQPSRLMGRLVFGSFNLRFLPARTPFDWLSAAPEAVDRYQRDPLCGFDCTPALWADLLGGIVALEAGEAEGAALPTGLRVLAMAGTHDPVSLGGLGCTQLARRYRAAGVEDVTSRRYPHGRHELLNDLEASTVTADLLHWIDERWPG